MSIVINGSGTITGITAGGLPDATITQAELATGVAGTGPAFSAYNSSAQSVSTGTWSAVQMQTEIFDTASCFNNTGSTVGGIPAYSFLPNVAGYYEINGCVSIAQVGTYYDAIAIYKNGAADKNGNITFASAASYPSSNASALIYLNGSTDYVTLYVLHNQGTSQLTLNQYPSTYFTGVLVRAA